MDKMLYDRTDLFRRGIRLSNTTLLRLEGEGVFPRRKYLTPRNVVWPAEAVEAYLLGLIEVGGEEANG
ncbi:MAG: helix-turn-helix transcriptional regulator [Parasphingopyxis sp.]|uniref:helix-turn-helix transcriptional regulator n=1 Tax=Parasphingopyxis sp. TaxID=1920299 RepID=UPI003FA14302